MKTDTRNAGGTTKVFPGSGAGGGSIEGNMAVLGLMVFGLFLWEVFYHGNGRRWPVWSLMLPTVSCFYLAASGGPSDLTLYWLAFALPTAIGFFIYVAFWVDEKAKGRR